MPSECWHCGAPRYNDWRSCYLCARPADGPARGPGQRVAAVPESAVDTRTQAARPGPRECEYRRRWRAAFGNLVD